MLVGQTIGNPAKGEFFIEKELGSGAMGTVYRARLKVKDKTLPVALKVVSLGLLGNEPAMKRFDRESTILKQLKHPHIVRLYGTGWFRGTPYIAMEFVDGEPLDRALARRGKLGWEEVLGYGKQLCDALQHAHDKGIIHRDLKPSNLMITADGQLKLADFGIAKDTDVTALTAANSTIGTAAYMSPEQCRGTRDLTPKSDLYSLGVVFYELISGKKPFYADNTMDMFLKHVNEQPVRVGKLVPDLPVWVDNLVMHLLEKTTDTRPYDAVTVKRMIEGIEEKVRTQQSAGVDVATARRTDRKLNETAAVTAADREAARAIKGKKRKKKKATPLLQQAWVKALGIGLVLAGLVGAGVWLMLPPGPDKAFEQVKRATAEGKREAARDFLAQYGSSGHPSVDEAKAIYKAAQTNYIEGTVQTRAGKGDGKVSGRKTYEGEDEAVMTNVWAAIDAERGGDPKAAAAHWKYVRDHVPDPDWTKVGDDDAMRYTPNKWVAEKRLADLDAAGKLHPQLLAKTDDLRVNERFADDNPADPEVQAVKAVRLEQFGDPAKASKAWDRLAANTAGEPDRLRWFLLATERRAATRPEKDKEAEAAAERVKAVTAKVQAAADRWAKAKDDKVDNVGPRDVRIACREVIDLYDDESDDAIKTQVKAARALLAEAEKR